MAASHTKWRKVGIDVSPGPVFLSKKRGGLADVSTGLISSHTQKKIGLGSTTESAGGGGQEVGSSAGFLQEETELPLSHRKIVPVMASPLPCPNAMFLSTSVPFLSSPI